ncbi:MAG: M48 family metallopeptidase [Pseudomonadota bacterium]
MKYENPEPPEEVNYPTDHPLRELAILLAGALAVVAVLVVVLSVSAGWLARQIPFAVERGWATQFADRLPAREPDPLRDAAEARLQAMAERVAGLQGMPADMRPVVHLLDDDRINAFATLGGHVMVTRGILEKLPHENALVLLLAHEIAHVKHRDPVVALGRGLAVMTALATLGGVGDGGAMTGRLQDAGLLTMLSFNRGQESAADEEALRTLALWYGHTAGATALFDVLVRAAAGHEPPEFMSTHPASEDRLARMEAAETSGDTVPLPGEVVAWLAAD